jgi:hypothetical protein
MDTLHDIGLHYQTMVSFICAEPVLLRCLVFYML